MAAMIKGSRYLSRVAGRESEIPALMWAAAAFVAVGASVSSGWSMTVLNQLLPRGVNDPGDMSNGEIQRSSQFTKHLRSLKLPKSRLVLRLRSRLDLLYLSSSACWVLRRHEVAR